MDADGRPVTLFRTEVAGLRLLRTQHKDLEGVVGCAGSVTQECGLQEIAGRRHQLHLSALVSGTYVRLPPRGLSICLVVRWRKRPAQSAGDRRQEADRFGLHVNVTSSSFFLATSSICFPPFSATTGILVGGQPHGEADGVRKLHLKVSSQIIVGKAFSLDPSPET
jgi:hypothetical protein